MYGLIRSRKENDSTAREGDLTRCQPPSAPPHAARIPILRGIHDHIVTPAGCAERRLFARSPPRAVNTLRDCWRACGPARVRAGLADVCGGIVGRVGRWLRYWAGVPSASGAGPAVMLVRTSLMLPGR